MKIKVLLIISVWFSVSASAQQQNSAFETAVSKWFTAWQLLSNDVFGVKDVQPVDFIFFDSVNMYRTTGPLLPGANSVKGPSLMNLSFKWEKKAHHGSIPLPDSGFIQPGILCFASENKKTGKPYFVMPLPSFWQAAGVSSTELGLENLVTGVFLHEFSHSQQMQNFGKQLTNFENTLDFGVTFTDDIVQDIFKEDSNFLRLYTNESNGFYKAVTENNRQQKIELIRSNLISMENRRKNYFKEKFSEMRKLEDFFLTMEGLGQYAMYAWLIHPKGANIPKEEAIKGVRRGKKHWSQDEGFVLFLLLEQFALPKSWALPLMKNETTPVTHLLLNAIIKKK